jgi:hypothetical protein
VQVLKLLNHRGYGLHAAINAEAITEGDRERLPLISRQALDHVDRHRLLIGGERRGGVRLVDHNPAGGSGQGFSGDLDGFGLSGGGWCRLGFGSLRISGPNKAKQASQQLRDAGAFSSYVGATGVTEADLNKTGLGRTAEPGKAVGGSFTGSGDRVDANPGDGLESGQRCRKGNVSLESSKGELSTHGVHVWAKVLHLETLALAKGICNQSAAYQLRAEHLQ